MFKSSTCFDNHKAHTSRTECLCNTVKRRKECLTHKTENRKNLHVCGEIFYEI